MEGKESDYLRLLNVIQKMVAKEIRDMKGNKSTSQITIEFFFEQISIPFATVLNVSLEEGVVPLDWKEASNIPLFKKGSRNKSENYRPVSLTSVICKLLERLIKDHLVDFLVKLDKPISTFLGSIQPHATIKVRKAARTHIHHCILPGTHLFSK